MKRKGMSLLELTIGSTLMGLLFMSGLQLLSSLFLVQTRFTPSQNVLNFESLLVKTQLEQALQEAEILNVSLDHLSLHFQNQTGEHQIRFQNTPMFGISGKTRHNWLIGPPRPSSRNLAFKNPARISWKSKCLLKKQRSPYGSEIPASFSQRLHAIGAFALHQHHYGTDWHQFN